MTTALFIAAVIVTGIITMKFDNFNLSRIFKKSPVESGMKLFYRAKKK
jgi:hypothetical protein